MHPHRTFRTPLLAVAAALLGTLGCAQLPGTPSTFAVHGPSFVRAPAPTRAARAALTGSGRIASKFNGTAIPAGSTLWFTSVIKYSGAGTLVPVVIRVDPGTIEFSVNGSARSVPVPAGTIVLSPTAAIATTSFDEATGTWTTVTPFHTAGTVFLTGAALPLPDGLPGGLNPVTWNAHFTSSTRGVNVSWQWSAAAYRTFAPDLAHLAVKPVDDKARSSWRNDHHAGTPEQLTSQLIGGATGGGGSNFTGGLSATLLTVPDLLTSGPLSGSAQIDGGKGGTLTVGRFTLQVPAGAYDGSATLGIYVADQGVLQCDLSISPLTANHFAAPVMLTSSYAGATVADPSALVEVWLDPTTNLWRLVPGSSVDAVQQVVTVPLSHFSSYGVADGRAGW